jgi:hypothetical protein
MQHAYSICNVTLDTLVSTVLGRKRMNMHMYMQCICGVAASVKLDSPRLICYATLA